MQDPASNLWKHLKSQEKISLLTTLRSKVQPILANNLLPHFTDHSVEHSDRVTQLVDHLVQPLQQSGEKLNPAELTAIYATAYLHDIGMQFENAGRTEVIQRLGLAVSWDDLPEQKRRDLLRDHHPEISAEMVRNSANGTGEVGMVLPGDLEPAAVAALCHAHALDPQSEQYEQLMYDSPSLRMSLLSGILRMADILDESQVRAQRGKADSLLLDAVAGMHWWRHHYTVDVKFSHNERTITIWFEFPPALGDEYSRVIPELQVPLIQEELECHQAVFRRYGLDWSVHHKIQSPPYGAQETMPESVWGEMQRNLFGRRTAKVQQQRFAVVRHFQDVQPSIQKKLAELEETKNSTSAADYLRRLDLLVRECIAIEGLRSGCALLTGAYLRNREALPLSEQFKMGLRLAGALISDGRPDRALDVLKPLEPQANSLDDQTPQSETFAKLWLSCLVETFDLDTAQEALRRALDSDLDASVKNELKAIILEACHLRGLPSTNVT